MATKAETTAWMEIWREREREHAIELEIRETAHLLSIKEADCQAWDRGYKAALEDVQNMPVWSRLFKRRLVKAVSS